jgi:hypothetical protein
MSVLDHFVEELRASVAGNPPELERLEDCLRVLQTDDSAAAVDDYDRIVRILRRPVPLHERLAAVMLTMLTGRL